MKKSFIILLLSLLLLMSGCGEEASPKMGGKNAPLDGVMNADGQAEDGAETEPEPINIEDLDWFVEEAYVNANRNVMFGYTNNSEYVVLGVDLRMKLKDELTEEERAALASFEETRRYDDETLSRMTVSGNNGRLAEPGETVGGAPCKVDTFTELEHMELFDLTVPEKMKVNYVGRNGKIYDVTYDYAEQKYGFVYEIGDTTKWAGKELGKTVPKPDKLVSVTTDSDDLFFFWAYDTTNTDFLAYTRQCIAAGYSEGQMPDAERFSAINPAGYTIEISHDATDDFMSVVVERWHSWSESEISGLLPKLTDKLVRVSDDKDEWFEFYAFDISQEEFNEYVEACKAAGFSFDVTDSDRRFSARDENNEYKIVAYYYPSKCIMNCSVYS
ncbi:MAG: hypothetical protein J1F63_10885 [Oscillospiraceae bacterium]|nr:hypothetical protein [Oscillospiraceae bacterium]